MKKLLFGIFAHPDDEAFGPSGTLYLAAQAGVDIHTISATHGDAGMNVDHVTDLAELRTAETKRAAELIGTKSTNFLEFADSKICNDQYLDLAGQIINTVQQIIETYTEPVEVDFMTFDSNGLSGHIDHIAVSLATTFSYLKLRDERLEMASLGRLRYFCLSEIAQPAPGTSWLYMPKGHPLTYIDETIDVSAVYEQKLAIMHAHYSQRSDAEYLIKTFGDHLKKECFFYFKD